MMTRVLWWEKGEGNHREGRMTGTRDQFDVAVRLGEIEEPRTKPRPLAWSLGWWCHSLSWDTQKSRIGVGVAEGLSLGLDIV